MMPSVRYANLTRRELLEYSRIHILQVLGPGLNLHLAENDLLRDVFELGERPSLLNGAMQKTTKLERVSGEFVSLTHTHINRITEKSGKYCSNSCVVT